MNVTAARSRSLRRKRDEKNCSDYRYVRAQSSELGDTSLLTKCHGES